MKACSADAECTLVATGCDFCCQQQAINAAFADRYEREFGQACSGYQGGVCDCIALPAEARCEAQTCKAVAVGTVEVE